MTLRIISLIASSTEIIHALGLTGNMVGRSHECDYPDTIKDLPVCTSPKFRTDGTSYEIDQRVKAIVQEGLSVYRVDADMVESLSPSHIITQDQCQVCAVSLRDVEEAACAVISSKPQIVSLKPDCLEDIFDDVRTVGSALQVPDRAASVVADMQTRIEVVRKGTSAAARGAGPRVACIEWIEPLMAAGNWIPELVELASGVNLFGRAGKHSPWMTMEELVAADPDVIIVTPCGFDIERTLTEMHLLYENPGFAALEAVRHGRVVVADGNQYFNRPGPRTVDALEMMAEIFYPGRFDFGHESRGWVKYSIDTRRSDPG